MTQPSETRACVWRLVAMLSLLCCATAAADRPSASLKDNTTRPAAERANSQKRQPMHLNNPYFTLRVQTESLPYGVYVNGAPLTADETGGPSNETWPINHMLRSTGDNEIAFVAPPYEGEDGKGAFEKTAKATLTVLVQEAGHLDKPGLPVMRLCFVGARAGTPRATEGSSPEGRFDSTREFTSSKTGDVSVGKPTARALNAQGVLWISRTFSANLSLPEWEFLTSDVMPNFLEGAPSEAEAERIYAELLAAYETVWKGLKSGNIDSILPLFEERSRNTDRAFYLNPGTTQQRLKDSFVEVLKDRSMSLQPIRVEDYWSIETAPRGHLMRLVRGEHSSAILRFQDKDGLSVVYSVSFRRKGGKYIIAL